MWPIYGINSVDDTKLPLYTLPQMQHHSFFRNLPPFQIKHVQLQARAIILVVKLLARATLSFLGGRDRLTIRFISLIFLRKVHHVT